MTNYLMLSKEVMIENSLRLLVLVVPSAEIIPPGLCFILNIIFSEKLS